MGQWPIQSCHSHPGVGLPGAGTSPVPGVPHSPGDGRSRKNGGGSMIRRQCPGCGSDWYSASTKPWTCAKCGATLDDRHGKPLERWVANEDSSYVYGE